MTLVSLRNAQGDAPGSTRNFSAQPLLPH